MNKNLSLRGGLATDAWITLVWERVWSHNFSIYLDYEFSHPFEPPIEAGTSFYVGILAQKAIRLGRLLDPGWYAPLLDPSPLLDGHPPAPLSLTHYRLVMCVAARSELPGKGSTGTLFRGGEIVTFKILPGCHDKCPHNYTITH